MKILVCTTSFQKITNGPTKFANFLYQKCQASSDLEVHVLTEDIPKEGIRLYKCHIGFLKKILPVAPVYRMIKYYAKSEDLNSIYNFDYIIYNNAIYGLIHAFFKNNVVGMINDYNNQKNISSGFVFSYSFLKKSIFKYFEKKAIKHSHLILTNSEFLTKELKCHYPKYTRKIKRLYKGIELKENLRKNNYHWHVEDVNSIKILFVKNDFITGGLRILAKSLAFINLHFTVTIAGPDLKFEEEIKSYFQSPNIELNFIGRQSQKQVFNHMATQHIFCVPSLQEALGVANLEALNIGIPVVSTDAGGIPEALGYGSCGFLCKVADAVSLSDALQACIYNFEERNRKVLNGFKHVKKFKAEFIINNLNSILNERV